MKKQMAMVKISTQMNASSLRAPHACRNKNVNVSAPVTVVRKCGLCVSRALVFFFVRTDEDFVADDNMLP